MKRTIQIPYAGTYSGNAARQSVSVPAEPWDVPPAPKPITRAAKVAVTRIGSDGTVSDIVEDASVDCWLKGVAE